MNTVEHRARGQTYKFTGANADLWQIATEQPRLFQGEALDELARALGSMDDNERVAASKKIITGLWVAHASLGPYPFLDCLSKFEFDRYFHHKYRDHVCHQLKVYLLGLGILGCTHPIRDEVERLVGNDVDRIWLVTAVFHDLGYVIENDRAHPGAESWERVCKSYRDVMRNPLKQIIEDEGLSELTEQQIQKGYSIATPTLDGMGDLEQDGLFQAFREEGERARLAHLQFGPRDRPPVQKYYEYAQKTTYKRPPFRDHGVASALLLVKTWRDFDVYLDRLLAQPFPLHEQPNGAAAALQRISARVSALRDERRELGPRIMRAAGAMSLHNISPGQWNHLDAGTHGLTFDTFKIAIGAQSPETANPLASLLAFVDTLQDWDRPTFSETPNENALHSHDLSITPDRYRKKVLVYVKRDAEEFIDPPTMKHSRYQRVVGCLKEYLDSDEVDSLIEWCRPEPPSKLEYALEPRESVLRPRSELDFNAVVNIPANDPWQWTVVLTRDEASRHGELMTSLRCSEMAGNSRFIDSGFAYWGIGPTIQWRRACTDDYYVVMRKGIATFSGR